MKTKQKGFTLIELLVVIAIIAILAISITVGYQSVKKSAKNSKIREAVRSISTAQEVYRNAQETYASDVDDLDVGNLDSIELPSGETWEDMTGSTSSWSLSIDLFGGGKFSCNQDGCSED